jgi:hypothetical protein
MFGVTLQTGSLSIGVEPATYRLIAFSWLFGGLVAFAVFGGMAEILERLQRLEAINR